MFRRRSANCRKLSTCCRTFRWTRTAKNSIPHTLTDNRGERYICSSDVADVHAEDTCTTSAVTSFRFAYRWLMVFELAIRKPEAWKDFQAHGKI